MDASRREERIPPSPEKPAQKPVVMTRRDLGVNRSLVSNESTAPISSIALVDAIWRGNTWRVDQCIKNKVDLNGMCFDGCTPLVAAVMKRDSAMVSKLLNNGANPNEKGVSSLLTAVANGLYEIARLLLVHKANPNVATKSGYTPIMLAFQRGDIQTANLLMEKGASLFQVAEDGESPLSLAYSGCDRRYILSIRKAMGRESRIS